MGMRAGEVAGLVEVECFAQCDRCLSAGQGGGVVYFCRDLMVGAVRALAAWGMGGALSY